MLSIPETIIFTLDFFSKEIILDNLNIILHEIMKYTNHLQDHHKEFFIDSLYLIETAEYSRVREDSGCLFLFKARLDEPQYQTIFCEDCGEFCMTESFVPDNIVCNCLIF